MLPDLYSRWVTDWLGAPPPEEPLATCADCAMCVKGDGRTPTASYFFEPEMKCCVYQPSLPNFLAGRSVGVDTVRARIEAGIGVGPLVLERPPSYDLVHRHTINAAGRTKALRCPHFVTADGTCGIWENRDALCATWFCRHVRGRTGFLFWHALRELLMTVEEELARWAALELGAPPPAFARSLPQRDGDSSPAKVEGDAVDGRVDPVAYSAAWGEWEGREVEFYRDCAARVDALSAADVEAIAGTEVRARLRRVRAAFAALTDASIPDALRVGQHTVVATRDGGVRVVTYSSLDAVDLPVQLLPLLPVFDGRPTSEALDTLRATHGVELEPGFLRTLLDWGILVV